MNARAAIAVVLARGLGALPARAAEFRTIGERPAILYDAPSAKADRLFVASRFYPLEVLVKLDQWTKVRDVNGEVAWVENKSLGDRRTALVTVPLADVRAAPRPRSRRSSSRPTSTSCSRSSSRPPTAG